MLRRTKVTLLSSDKEHGILDELCTRQNTVLLIELRMKTYDFALRPREVTQPRGSQKAYLILSWVVEYLGPVERFVREIHSDVDGVALGRLAVKCDGSLESHGRLYLQSRLYSAILQLAVHAERGELQDMRAVVIVIIHYLTRRGGAAPATEPDGDLSGLETQPALAVELEQEREREQTGRLVFVSPVLHAFELRPETCVACFAPHDSASVRAGRTLRARLKVSSASSKSLSTDIFRLLRSMLENGSWNENASPTRREMSVHGSSESLCPKFFSWIRGITTPIPAGRLTIKRDPAKSGP
jgi:hypothetical protein